MIFTYNADNPILKFELVPEDTSTVNASEQYLNLVKSIKDILADSTIADLDKKELLGVLRNKTKQPIMSLDELRQLLDDWADYGNRLSHVESKMQNYVDTHEDDEARIYSTSSDDSLNELHEPIAQAFDPEVTDEE